MSDSNSLKYVGIGISSLGIVVTLVLAVEGVSASRDRAGEIHAELSRLDGELSSVERLLVPRTRMEPSTTQLMAVRMSGGTVTEEIPAAIDDIKRRSETGLGAVAELRSRIDGNRPSGKLGMLSDDEYQASHDSIAAIEVRVVSAMTSARLIESDADGVDGRLTSVARVHGARLSSYAQFKAQELLARIDGCDDADPTSQVACLTGILWTKDDLQGPPPARLTTQELMAWRDLNVAVDATAFAEFVADNPFTSSSEGIVYQVTARSLRVREGPVDGEQVASLRRGEQVRYLGESSGPWWQIVGPRGIRGWVHSGYLNGS